MRYIPLLFVMSMACTSTSTTSESESVEDIHMNAILVDTHNDILMRTMENGFVFDRDLDGKTHTDLKRMKEGGLDVQFFSVWSDGNQVNPYDYANKQIDSLDAVLKRNPDKIVKVANTTELNSVLAQGKIAALIGIEGGHQIEDDIEKLDALYKRGARYMTLTWNNSTSWATSASDEKFNADYEGKGLNDFGREIVQHMNSLGMLVDISHVGKQTFWDVIATTSKPVIASHSSVFALCPHQRNLNDDQIKAVAKNGGVIQINFNSGFIDPTVDAREAAFLDKHRAEIDSLKATGANPFYAEELMYAKYPDESEPLRAPFSLVIDHIDYITKLVGADYVGIGSDFDGIVLPPLQLDDVTTYPLITKALLDKGYSKEDIEKVLGGNLLRVLKTNEVN